MSMNNFVCVHLFTNADHTVNTAFVQNHHKTVYLTATIPSVSNCTTQAEIYRLFNHLLPGHQGGVCGVHGLLEAGHQVRLRQGLGPQSHLPHTRHTDT